MSERDLELLLERTAASMAYPATPQLRGRVLGSIASGARAVERPKRPAFAFATVAAAVTAFAVMIALAVPGSRSAIAEFFGIERSKIERLPTPSPGATATALPASSELPPGAREVSIQEATAALGFAPANPSVLGEPAAIYVVDYPGEAVVISRFADLDLWQAKPRGALFVKGVPEGVVVLELRTPGGRDAYFIEGGPHTVHVNDNDAAVPGSERTVERNTLILSSDRAFYRIETELPRSAALLELADVLP